SQLGLPSATVNGELTYNPATRSYWTDNLTIDYGETVDFIKGTIQWSKDVDYLKSGQSEYRFGLTFTNKPSKKLAGQPNTHVEKEQQMLRDPSVSKLTGTVTYADEGTHSIIDGAEFIVPHVSKVAFHLNANRLSSTQIHTFLR